MTIDLSTLNGTTNIQANDEAFEVYADEAEHEERMTFGWQETRLSYPFRYTVHRQYVGFFTPMVFDVIFRLAVDADYASGAKVNFEKIVEPFVEGALFVNHTSHTLVEFLKGQPQGFNRVSLVNGIKSSIAPLPDGSFTPVWYSDWDVPPLTIQSQRVFAYDMDNEHHGSMLDPVNALQFIQRWYAYANSGQYLKGFVDRARITGMWITAGYTQKVAHHARG